MNHRWVLPVALATIVACRRDEVGSTSVSAPGVAVQQGPNGQTVTVQGANGAGVTVRQGAGGTQVQIGAMAVGAPSAPPAVAAPTVPTVPTGAAGARGGTPSPTIHCSSNQVIERSGVEVHGGDEAAVVADGACQLRLTNCVLDSNAAAVDVSGAAQVTLENCTVRGGRAAIDASGTAQVTHRNSSLTGAVEHSGMAQITGG